MRQHDLTTVGFHPAPNKRDAKAEDAAIQEAFRASQRRGQWTRLVQKIDELRFRANVNRREPTESGVARILILSGRCFDMGRTSVLVIMPLI